MSSLGSPPAGPPPSGPPPAGRPPSSPPPSGPPPAGPPSRRSPLPWIVAGVALLVVLAFGGAVVAFTGGDAGSVDEVAEQAVDAAEDLDVDAGIDLLCSAPDDEEREGLDELISEAQDKAGTDEPDVDYDISEIEGDADGSFLVTITSDESDLEGRDISLRVLVADDDGRSCIDGVEEPESGESYDL